MKEQLVLFETAKLAKEKGFDVTCYAKYETWRDELKKCHVDCPENAIAEYEVADNDSYSRYGNYILEEYKNTYSKNYITAPTQSLLQKWLRVEHNIDVVIIPERYSDGINYTVQAQKWDLTCDSNSNPNFVIKGSYWFNDNGEYPTYEEALEKGLQEALKLIK